jgi:hypothetical protein
MRSCRVDKRSVAITSTTIATGKQMKAVASVATAIKMSVIPEQRAVPNKPMAPMLVIPLVAQVSAPAKVVNGALARARPSPNRKRSAAITSMTIAMARSTKAVAFVTQGKPDLATQARREHEALALAATAWKTAPTVNGALVRAISDPNPKFAAIASTTIAMVKLMKAAPAHASTNLAKPPQIAITASSASISEQPKPPTPVAFKIAPAEEISAYKMATDERPALTLPAIKITP